MGGAAIIVAIVAVALLGLIVAFAISSGGLLKRERDRGRLGEEPGGERPEHVAVGTPEQQEEMAAAGRAERRRGN